MDIDSIIFGCQQGDKHSQRQLYDLAAMKFLVQCHGYTNDQQEATNVFNAAMLKVFIHINSYQHEEKLFAWIGKIVRNTCLDHVKKDTGKFVPIDAPASENIPLVDSDIVDRLSVMEILKILETIPERPKKVFKLYVIAGCSHLEIAALLNIPENTSKWLLSDARKRLRDKLIN